MSHITSSAPRVSVIVRTRNRLDLLGRAIDDIFRQSFDDLELIVVDDADQAGDALSFVASLTQDRANRVRLISREGQPHGRWLAANAGLEVARGEFISLHDDDDWWDPEFLAQTVRFLDEHPATPAVCSRTTIVIERPGLSGGLTETDAYAFLPELSSISLMDMLRANRIPPISMLYRRALHEEVGPYDSSLNYLGDWDFYLRVIARYPIALLEQPPLAFWSHRPESTGDDRNSISAASLRAATDDAIRDAYVRRGVAELGLPLFVHIAHESRWLEQRMTSRFDRIDMTVAARADELSEQLTTFATQLGALREEIVRLRGDVFRRTSLTGILMRPLRVLRSRLRR